VSDQRPARPDPRLGLRRPGRGRGAAGVTLPYAHAQPCNCVCCETVRVEAFRGPGLYQAIGRRDAPSHSGTTTWTLDAFLWGLSVPPGQLVWVEREVLREEKGGHLKGVVVW